MEINKERREQARMLKYHQRRALKRLAADIPSHHGIGPRTTQQLLNAGLATYRFNGVRSLVLTEAGVLLYDALGDLGWLPPD